MAGIEYDLTGLSLPVVLERIELMQSSDDLKTNLEVTCGQCTGVICDAEPDDSLGTLVRVAMSHLDGCNPSTCKHCGHEIFHVKDEGWVAPDAGTDREGGDGIWRDYCPDNQESREAPHEPEV